MFTKNIKDLISIYLYFTLNTVMFNLCSRLMETLHNYFKI